MQNDIISTVLSENETYLKNTIGQSFNTYYRHFVIPVLDNNSALIVYIKGLVEEKELNEYLLTPSMSVMPSQIENDSLRNLRPITRLLASYLTVSAANESAKWQDICDSIMAGKAVLFLDKCDTAVTLSTDSHNSRTITEPLAESEVRGPRDGFIENINNNVSLIRRRIKDYHLRFENMPVGERTKTVVSLAYIDNLVDKSMLN